MASHPALQSVGRLAGGAALTAGVGTAYATGGAGTVQEGAAATLDMATPGIMESAMYGMAMHSPIRTGGLASGGLVGYSTFFSGFDPATDSSTFRRFSIGRAAGEVVSLAARGLRGLGLDTEFVQRATQFNKYGMGAFIDPKTELITSPNKFGAAVTKEGAKFPKSQSYRVGPSRFESAAEAKAKLSQAKPKAVFSGKPGFAKGGAESGLYKLMSTLSGRGYKMGEEGAEVAVEVVEETVGGNKLAMTKASGTVGKVFTGAGATALSVAARGVAAYEVLSIAKDAATYAIGQGYKSMVDSATQLQQRMGMENYMSGGYFNRAATSERQRVMQTMNRNRLAPRDQIFGNEAFYGHSM